MLATDVLPVIMPAVAACPRLSAREWSFWDVVGVDCSAPEPRCIWVAVFRDNLLITHTPSIESPPTQPRTDLCGNRVMDELQAATCPRRLRKDGMNSVEVKAISTAVIL
ncbi:rho GTPase-activating protein 23 isoform X1 [Tachysurus ichikawai]